MANALYPLFKKRLMLAGLDLNALAVRAHLVNVSGGGVLYTYSAAHETLEDVPSDAIIATSGPLTGKTFADDAWFNSDDPTLTGVSGAQVEAIILSADTGTTGFLIMYQDTGVTGLPLTPDGSDIAIVVDSSGWFRL